MCCPPKYPPAMAFIAIALFLIVHGFFSVKAVYIPVPTNLKLVSVKQCPDGDENIIKLDVTITEQNETSQTLNGRFYQPLFIDDEFRVTVKELRMEDRDWAVKKIRINDKNLCSVLDNFVWEMIDRTKIRKMQSNSVCPILGGDHKIQNFVLNFKDIEAPPEAMGHVKYQVVLTNEGQQVMCEEFEFNNSFGYDSLLN